MKARATNPSSLAHGLAAVSAKTSDIAGDGDMIETGIPDPTKVVRVALQNAASIAGLLITTEAMIAEAPKKERHLPPRMGDMGGC